MSEENLRRSAARGVRWTASSAAARAALGFIQLAVLARLLDPEDFGLAATTTVVLAVVGLFSDLGLNNALIARRPRDPRVLSSLYWANVAMATALSIIALIGAPLVALAFGEPDLRGLVSLAAVGFVVAAIGQQFQVLLQRDLRFDLLAKIEVRAQLVTFAVSVGAAAAGAGATAIVMGMLAGAAAKSAQLIAQSAIVGRPRRHFRAAELRDYVGFGAFQIGERLLGYLGANVDYLLIGLFLGPEALGAYFIAFQLVVKPLLLLNPALTRVAFPVLARRAGDDAALRRGFLEVTRLVALAVAPLLTVIAVSADHLVPVLFGPAYEPSVVLIQLLAAVGLGRALSHPIGSVLLAKNRPDLLFKVAAVNVTALSAGLLVGVQSGVVGVAVAYLVVGSVAHALWPIFLRRALGLAPRDYLATLARPLGYAAICGAAAAGVLVAVGGPAAEPRGWRLAAMAITAVATLAAVLATWERRYLRELAGLLRAAPGTGPPAGRRSAGPRGAV